MKLLIASSPPPQPLCEVVLQLLILVENTDHVCVVVVKISHLFCFFFADTLMTNLRVGQKLVRIKLKLLLVEAIVDSTLHLECKLFLFVACQFLGTRVGRTYDSNLFL